MKIKLELTEEQLEIVKRALNQVAEKYLVLTADSNRDGSKNLSIALWAEQCKFADVYEYISKQSACASR